MNTTIIDAFNEMVQEKVNNLKIEKLYLIAVVVQAETFKESIKSTDKTLKYPYCFAQTTKEFRSILFRDVSKTHLQIALH